MKLTSLSVLLIPFLKAFVEGSPDSTDTQQVEHVKRVAVIGAGAGGSSTAYHLRKFAALSDTPVNITVFERSGYVGGRSTTVLAYGDSEPVELGASIFVEVNKILVNSSAEFGLRNQESETEAEELLGIWNGKEFVYSHLERDGWGSYWNIAKLLWKYGLAPIRTQRLMQSTISKFLKLYTSPFFPFRSLSSRAMDLDLVSTIAMTGEQFLAKNNIVGAFTTDIIQASTRVNYGQNLRLINGLLSMVCMAAEGAMQIDGGNWQIFDGMLKASNATVYLNSTVTGISKQNGQYSVKTSSLDTTNEELFDTVVLAAPLQFSSINIDQAQFHHVPDKIPYVTLYVTLFTSERILNPVFFGLAPTDKCPDTILTTLPPDEVPADPEDGVGSPGFFSISTLRTVTNPKTGAREILYKIFSPRKVDATFLSGILGAPVPEDLDTISPDRGEAITWLYPHVWKSYPYEYPRVTFEEIELARGFYYTSGIESFISTMETSALMGMNVARLIADDFEGLQVKEDTKQHVFSESKLDGHLEDL